MKLAYRMIGNAVPPHLGKAIGGELLKVRISEFENKPRDRDPASETQDQDRARPNLQQRS